MDSTFELVTLKGGYVIPLPALELALALENRSLRLSVQPLETGPVLRVSDREGGKPTLSEAEIAAIRQWKFHLIGLVGYDPDGAAQSAAQPAESAQKRPRRERQKTLPVVAST